MEKSPTDTSITEREGKKVKLRCVMKKTDKGYVGVCLELSLAVRESTPRKCKEHLEQLIEDYTKDLFMLYKEHGKVGTRPVEYYLIKRVLFDVKYCFRNLFKPESRETEFVTTAVVPVAV